MPGVQPGVNKLLFTPGCTPPSFRTKWCRRLRKMTPTADPVLLARAAYALPPRIVEGVKYVRAGIMVTDLRPTGNQKPLELFENPHEERHIGQLLEDVSQKYGRGSIGLGSAGVKGGPDWSMKRDMLSPRYTTHWDELPVAKAS